MNEIYWITRLDAICGFLVIMSLFGVVISILLFVSAISHRNEASIYEEGGNSWNEHMKTNQTLTYYCKRSTIATLLLIVINIFVPTKNDALLIYGVGGTIDYIKSNDTAKQLPDKCIKALDKWVENLNEETQKQNDNESK